jgi:hypothetical protein
MPVPSSGELKLRADINLEVNGNATDDNVSLGSLSNEVGFTEPDTMSEFYGYVSYTQPTISGTPSSSSVLDTSMTVTSPSFSNPSAGSVKRGFYFGTSTTMTNNTFYDIGNTTATSGTFNKSFTGLSGSTTYYVWAIIRDTQSPARFTEAVSSLKIQSTLATVNYSTYISSTWEVQASVTAYTGSGTSTWKFYYTHVYYGNTNYLNVSRYASGYFSGYGSAYTRYRYRSGGSTANEIWATGSYSDDAGGQFIYRNDSCSALGSASSYFSCSTTTSTSESGSGSSNYNSGWNNDLSYYRDASVDADPGASFSFTKKIFFTG